MFSGPTNFFVGEAAPVSFIRQFQYPTTQGFKRCPTSVCRYFVSFHFDTKPYTNLQTLMNSILQ